MSRPETSVLRRGLYLLPVLALACLVGVFALGLGHDPARLPSALIDQPAPAFDLPPLAPDKLGLGTADLHGPALINFFASWCVPCREEAPTLAGFAATGDVPIYGIAYKDKPAAARGFLASGNPYTRIGLDAAGRTGIDFGIYGIPETFILDAAGHIRFRYAGPITPDVLESQILPRLKALGR